MFVELKTIGLLWPEIVLVAAATSIIVGGAFQRSRTWWSIVAVVSYLGAAIAMLAGESAWNAASTFSGPVVSDSMGIGLRWLALLLGLVFTLVSSRLASRDLASEYIGSLMLLVAGVMLAAASNDLVMLFLGLELISIPTYVLLFLGRRDRASGEATMKYFFLSILSSSLLLYGFSFLYGIGGTTIIAGTSDLPGIREALLSGSQAPLLSLAPLALVLIVAGMGFKLAVAPFQFYAPDVYQGTTNANAGILAVAPKIAAIVALIRLVIVAMPAAAEYAWQLALVLSVLTMTIGNVCALWQKNIRRLLAYSSIAHGGYLLIGLATAAGASAVPAANLSGGVTAMLFYVIVYALATMGVFAALAYLGSENREVSGMEEIAGLGRSQPLVAGAIAVFMFSLAGVPPLAGFWGKLTLFGSAVEVAISPLENGMPAWFTALAVVGVMNAAIAAAYYLRVVAVMYFQPEHSAVSAGGGRGALVGALICAALVVGAGLLPSSLLSMTTQAEAKLQLKPVASSVQSPAAAQVASRESAR